MSYTYNKGVYKMSSDDRWSQAEEAILSDNIAKFKLLAKDERRLPCIGSCYGCGEDIPEPQIFCVIEDGKNCHELYERRRELHRQNNKII